MSRGKKLDLSIGADFGDGWGLVEEAQNKSAVVLITPEKHQLVFKKEKRRGKPVSIVGPFFLAKSECEALLKRLKQSLGCGGTLKEEALNTYWLELQGEVELKLRERLSLQEGFRLKRSS